LTTNSREFTILEFNSSHAPDREKTIRPVLLGTKPYRREVGGLAKGSKLTGCNDLTIIVLNGAEDTLSEDNKQVKVVPAAQWLVWLL